MATTKMKPSSVCLPLLLLLLAIQACTFYRFADAAKRRIHISDDLDDVVDDEEDEAWREWGKNKKKPDFDPPPDFNKMNVSEIQDEMMKRQFGPVFGFVKLRPGTGRGKDIVSEIAMKWTNVARTGAIEAKFMGVDLSTIMFSMEKGQDTIELKEFLLSQPEAYEIKIGDQLFRREGDPPFEEIFEKLRTEKSKSDDDAGSKKDERNDEL